mmetsp:Transcript_18851/g.47122  ORF Transcript_18851/g.47122 Transcript_18851/m.47122 type:complete len:121 (-) Transcript_18851:542-904(-)
MCPLLAGGAAMPAALRFVEEDALVLKFALCDFGCPFPALREFGDIVVVIHRGGPSLGLFRVVGRDGALRSTLLGKGPVRLCQCTQAIFSRGPWRGEVQLSQSACYDAAAFPGGNWATCIS